MQAYTAVVPYEPILFSRIYTRYAVPTKQLAEGDFLTSVFGEMASEVSPDSNFDASGAKAIGFSLSTMGLKFGFILAMMNERDRQMTPTNVHRQSIMERFDDVGGDFLFQSHAATSVEYNCVPAGNGLVIYKCVTDWEKARNPKAIGYLIHKHMEMNYNRVFCLK